MNEAFAYLDYLSNISTNEMNNKKRIQQHQTAIDSAKR